MRTPIYPYGWTFLCCLPWFVISGAGCSSATDEDISAGAEEVRADESPTPYPQYPSDDDALPPETDNAFTRTAPAATDTFVYVVNPDRDTVSKINASTRAVYTLPTGTHPIQVLTAGKNPGRSVVLNEASADLTLLNPQDDTTATVDIHPDTNYMVLSSDGLYAITYYNPNAEGANDDINGVRSYSNITVVFTGDQTVDAASTSLAVGLNPRSPSFIPSTGEAIVLCDNALAQITLSQTPSSRLIQLTDDVDEDLQVSEAKISPDGRFVFLRLTSIAQLLVVDLESTDPSLAVSRVDLPAVPSDMDISENSLILVDRVNKQLLVYQAQDPEELPIVIPTPANQLVGSIALSPETQKAVLYTTLTAKDIQGTAEEGTPLNRISVWTMTSDLIKIYEVVKPVKAVSLNNNVGLEVATIIHDGAADSELEAFDNEEAFSHFYFSDGLIVPTILESPIKALADSSSDRYQFQILEDDLNVVVVDYSTRQVSALAVQSLPVFVGILTGTGIAYVSQEHDLGRISFIEPDSLTLTTITGFELNSQP